MGLTGWVRCGCAASPCVHPNGDEATLDLGWRFIRSFRAELAEAGAAAYPALLRSTPEYSGGRVISPAEAVEALAELDRFEAEHPPIMMDRLADRQGARICQTASGQTCSFFTSHRSDGTFVLAGVVAGRFGVWPSADDPPRPVFTATEVEQLALGDGTLERLDPDTGRVLRPSVPVRLRDAATGATIDLRTSICHNASWFELVTLEVPANERYLALDELRRLCEASVRTGRPVNLA